MLGVDGEVVGSIASELTPISVGEAKKVIGSTSQYSTGESLAIAVLDFTAIARAYIRTVSKYSVPKVI